ncbi:hypothetical protein [Adlercreutzia sp. ZJ242]|uniref:hypothetical protein n=1 Tax=Adlercreutzia sp. ZJ242 TaxID=2709409 RepID=UPI0013EDE162|nr:hypothetical protein [Adlercreutzia sp. ZJ242]
MREKLYASRIVNRKITILDVPERYRDGVIALLNESDRKRCQDALVISGASTE